MKKNLLNEHFSLKSGLCLIFIGVFCFYFVATFCVDFLQNNPKALNGLIASLIAGSATGLGTIPLLFCRKISDKNMPFLLGIAGGMMLAASLFSLLVPAVESVTELAQNNSFFDSVLIAIPTALALIFGAFFMQILDKITPHEHVEHKHADKNLMLVVAAIALHNVPEGLAVGMSVTSGFDKGMTVGIAIQNIPEGWIVASALLAMGVSVWKSAFLALLSGLVEPVGGVIGVILGGMAGTALPVVLSAAAGAMLWVVSHELIPTSHKQGFETIGTVGFMLGISLMTLLTVGFN